MHFWLDFLDQSNEYSRGIIYGNPPQHHETDGYLESFKSSRYWVELAVWKFLQIICFCFRLWSRFIEMQISNFEFNSNQNTYTNFLWFVGNSRQKCQMELLVLNWKQIHLCHIFSFKETKQSIFTLISSIKS